MVSSEHSGARPGLLLVVLSLNPGGTERLVIDMAKRVADRYRVTVCCLDEPGRWAPQAVCAGIEVVALRRRPGFRPAIGLSLARVAHTRRIRLLHCHQYSPFVYGWIAATLFPKLRLVYTEHGRNSDAPPSRKQQLVNPVLARFRGPVVAVSQELREYLIASGFPASRVGVIYNGIDPGQRPQSGNREAARQLLGLEGGDFVVGTVGRLDPVKDLGTAIRAIGILRERCPSARLVLIGSGPERDHLCGLVGVEGLSSAVVFAGERSDVRDLLPAFDLYVNSSTSEGLSVTLLEAMAAALPIVATRVGGTPEVVADGETGILVPAESPVPLGEAMERMARDATLRRECGARGRARVMERFNEDRIIREYEAAYWTALCGKAS